MPADDSRRIGRMANRVAESFGSSLMIWRITFLRLTGRCCGSSSG